MQQITLAKWYGGSNLYNLNTPSSDIDERSICMNLEPSYILGTRRFDQEIKDKNEDKYSVEIRKFLVLLQKGSPSSIEVLFASENKFTHITEPIKELRRNKRKLINPETLFKSLRGFIIDTSFKSYMPVRVENNEDRNNKRATEINNYNYYPKAASTCIRLSIAGINFFMKGEYLVEMPKSSLASDIKYHPESFTCEQIKSFNQQYLNSFESAYENSRHRNGFKFDEDYTNEFLRELYLPCLTR